MATIDQVTIPAGTSTQPSSWMSGSDMPDTAGATGTAPAGSLYFRHDPTTGAQLGVGVYEKVPTSTNGAPVWRPLSTPHLIDVRRFGARGDGSADDSPAFNAAFAAARAAIQYPAGTAAVYAPAGTYRLDSPINMTIGQFNLVGDGMWQTVLLGNTGSGKCVVDMTGAVGSSVRDLSIFTFQDVGITVSVPTPSTYGVVWHRHGSGQSSELNRLERVHVSMHTNAEANAGQGTIALYNCACEGSSVRGCALRADSALVLTNTNVTGFSSTHTTTHQGSSLTVFEVDRDTYLTGLAKATVKIHGGADFRIDAFLNNQYSSVGLPAPYPFAVEVVGLTNDLYLGGSVEVCPVSLAVIGAQVRGLQYHHYHSHGAYNATANENGPANTQWFSNIWLDGATVQNSVIQPVPTAGNQDAGLARGEDFLIDGVNSHVYSSVIFAYGSQNLRLVAGSGTSSLHASTILTDGKVGDLALLGFVTVGGLLIVGSDGVRDSSVGSSRPAANQVAVGSQHFDTVSARPLWSDGTSWRDAAGTVV